MARLSHDNDDFRSDPQPAHGLYVFGLERTVLPEEMMGRRLKTEAEKAEAEPPEKDKEFTSYIFGVDFGAKRDPSCCAIIETRYKGDTGYYLVRGVKRYRLSILYGDIATQTRKIYEQVREQTVRAGLRFEATIICDSTGVGAPIVELLRKQLPSADIRAMTLTGGYTARFEGDDVYLPKALMVSNLLALFEDNRIFFSKRSRHLDEIIEELQNFEVKINEDSGVESFNAKTGRHDDAITAIGAAAYLAEYQKPIQLF